MNGARPLMIMPVAGEQRLPHHGGVTAASHPDLSRRLILAGRKLSGLLDRLRFSPPVQHVYNPLSYARKAYEAYLTRFGGSQKRVVFLGMNPGPFGMVQTGVPFGEVPAVRDWLGIREKIGKPPAEHPKRPVLGLACPRCEVSGQRLWGLFADRYGTADQFFADHLVLNYCPLAFIESSGRNRTPDKLPVEERAELMRLCDEHLVRVVAILSPEWVIGVGDFAWNRAREALPGSRCKIGKVLHPSPASPAANRNWAGIAERQLTDSGVWQVREGPRDGGV